VLSLRDLQIQFEMDLFDSKGAKGAYIKQDGIAAKDRIAIYRNNVFSNYREALKAVYPVVEKLVGEQFFRQTANRYINAYPSLSGDLNSYGGNFPQFLATFEPAKQLPYLPDVARLEWLMELVFHATDYTPRALAKLAAVPQSQYDELRFMLHPASQLFQSNYPIARIWQVNQPDWQGDCGVDLQMGGCQLLVCRETFLVVLKPLTLGEYTMLSRLAVGDNIATAFNKALALEPGLDLGAFLKRMVHEDILVDCCLHDVFVCYRSFKVS
jgi:hypothetical protein